MNRVIDCAAILLFLFTLLLEVSFALSILKDISNKIDKIFTDNEPKDNRKGDISFVSEEKQDGK